MLDHSTMQSKESQLPSNRVMHRLQGFDQKAHIAIDLGAKIHVSAAIDWQQTRGIASQSC
jgi:hypothetical protein